MKKNPKIEKITSEITSDEQEFVDLLNKADNDHELKLQLVQIAMGIEQQAKFRLNNLKKLNRSNLGQENADNTHYDKQRLNLESQASKRFNYLQAFEKDMFKGGLLEAVNKPEFEKVLKEIAAEFETKTYAIKNPRIKLISTQNYPNCGYLPKDLLCIGYNLQETINNMLIAPSELLKYYPNEVLSSDIELMVRRLAVLLYLGVFSELVSNNHKLERFNISILRFVSLYGNVIGKLFVEISKIADQDYLVGLEILNKINPTVESLEFERDFESNWALDYETIVCNVVAMNKTYFKHLIAYNIKETPKLSFLEKFASNIKELSRPLQKQEVSKNEEFLNGVIEQINSLEFYDLVAYNNDIIETQNNQKLIVAINKRMVRLMEDAIIDIKNLINTNAKIAGLYQQGDKSEFFQSIKNILGVDFELLGDSDKFSEKLFLSLKSHIKIENGFTIANNITLELPSVIFCSQKWQRIVNQYRDNKNKNKAFETLEKLLFELNLHGGAKNFVLFCLVNKKPNYGYHQGSNRDGNNFENCSIFEFSKESRIVINKSNEVVFVGDYH